MGRYYNGDIEGKFWVAVQSSDDADFFGVEGRPPNDYLEYGFDEDNLSNVKKGLDECLEELGKNKKILDDLNLEDKFIDYLDNLKIIKVDKLQLAYFTLVKIYKEIHKTITIEKN